ncbi:MAG: hypothetical protein ACKV2V_24695 [Blastocatellia bacterium]
MLFKSCPRSLPRGACLTPPHPDGRFAIIFLTNSMTLTYALFIRIIVILCLALPGYSAMARTPVAQDEEDGARRLWNKAFETERARNQSVSAVAAPPKNAPPRAGQNPFARSPPALRGRLTACSLA